MKTRMTLEIGTRLVDAAVAGALKRQTAVSVAVVDAAGQLVSMKRMDGALPASAELCRVKAETVTLFGMPTRDLATASAISSALSRPVALFGGGVPLRADGQLVGALGVAGGMPDHDHEIAAAAAAAEAL